MRNRLFFLSKDYIIAPHHFNRWLVPPSALAIHLSIGMAYGFSVFWKPLGNALMSNGQALASCSAGATTFADKMAGTLRALTATDCNWTQFDLGWMYTLFFVVLGCSAALWGGWLERAGPRKAGLLAMLCWCGGLLISAYGVSIHQLWLLWLGSGVIGGIGLGLGYISPVSTLIKWFPDRRGMATGLAIMGFGGGAMIGSPLATALINHFKTADSVGVWQTFVALAVIYAVFMLYGALTYRIPPIDYRPPNYAAKNIPQAMPSQHHVPLSLAHKTPQFWLLWLVLCMNVSATIGIIGSASPMLQETFGGSLLGKFEMNFALMKQDPALMVALAAVGASFVGLISIFNIVGRIGWASFSDKLGRKTSYSVFFVLGSLLYLLTAYAAHTQSLGIFIISLCIIASMYGGGFATIPAYLADLFGTQFVGAIHGRLLTAWSTAGIIGPVIVNYLHDTRLEAGVPYTKIYTPIFVALTLLLLLGFVANLLVTPVSTKYHHVTEQPTSDKRSAQPSSTNVAPHTLWLILSWVLVLIPIAYGLSHTVQKVMLLFK